MAGRSFSLSVLFGAKVAPSVAQSAHAVTNGLKEINREIDKTNEKARDRAEERALRDLGRASKGVGESFTRMGEVIKGTFEEVVLPVLAAAGAMFAFAESAGKAGQEIYVATKKIGISAEQYTALNYAAKEAGVSQEAFQTGLLRFNRTIGEALGGNKKAQLALKEAGIGRKDLFDARGQLRPTIDLFKVFAKTVEGVKNPILQGRLAVALMGRGGQQYLPLLIENAEKMNEQFKEARELHQVWSQTDINNAHEFHLAIERVGLALDGVKNDIGRALHPALTQIAGDMKNWIVQNNQFIKNKAIEWAKKFKEAWPGIRKEIKQTTDELRRIWTVIDSVVQSMGGWGPVLRTLIAAFITIKTLQMAAAFGSIVGAVINLGSALAKTIGIVGEGASAFKILTSELGPGTKALALLSKGFLGFFAILRTGAVWLVTNPFGLIILGIAALIAAVYEIWNHWSGLVSFFQTSWDDIKAAFDIGFIHGVAVAIDKAFLFILKGANDLVHDLTGIDFGAIISGWMDAAERAVEQSSFYQTLKPIFDFMTIGPTAPYGGTPQAIQSMPTIAPIAPIGVPGRRRARAAAGGSGTDLASLAGAAQMMGPSTTQIFNFNPTITVTGVSTADQPDVRGDVQAGLSDANDKFKKQYDQHAYQQARTAMR